MAPSGDRRWRLTFGAIQRRLPPSPSLVSPGLEVTSDWEVFVVSEVTMKDCDVLSEEFEDAIFSTVEQILAIRLITRFRGLESLVNLVFLDLSPAPKQLESDSSQNQLEGRFLEISA